ncbi:hypothetical protein, partial [Pasteurella multocida]|uniref:hypothetical protein n=1 Tax=Pasteurella multocida TaxID=747 RepID=UPI0020221FB8
MNKHKAQHSTAQHSTAQHSTAQHSTAQHSTAQHSTAQHSTAPVSYTHHRAHETRPHPACRHHPHLPPPSLVPCHPWYFSCPLYSPPSPRHPSR